MELGEGEPARGEALEVSKVLGGEGESGHYLLLAGVSLRGGHGEGYAGDEVARLVIMRGVCGGV